MMPVKCQQFIVRCTIWLLMEIVLGCFGLDNMADYSEFCFERYRLTIGQSVASIVALSQPQ